MAATNPFSPVSTVTRARYHESEGKWDEVTAMHDYQDGGVSFNELTDLSPKVWQIEWTGLSEAEAADIDAFFEEKKYDNSFEFITRDGLTYSQAYFAFGSYKKDHTKQWSQSRSMEIVYYPGIGTVT